jgi:hypothetical protein
MALGALLLAPAIWSQVSSMGAQGPSHLATQTKCSPLPTLQISDVRTVRTGDTLTSERVIDGTAFNDGKPLQFAEVRLYLGNKFVYHTITDEQGNLLLENLSVRRYQLLIKGMGTFDVEVTPPRIAQQSHYVFSSNHGCLDWGFSSD